jgi:hypothetical protein
MRVIFRQVIIILFLFHGSHVNGQYFVSVAKDFGGFVGSPCVIKLKTGKDLNGTLWAIIWNKLQVKTDKGEKIIIKPEEISSVSFDVSEAGDFVRHGLTDESKLLLEKNRELAEKDVFIFEDIGWGLLQWLNPGFSDKIKVYAYEVRENDPFDEVYQEDEEGNIIPGKGNGKISTSMKYLIVKSNSKQVLIDNSNYRRLLKEIFSDCAEMLDGFFDEKMRWNDIGRQVFIYTKLCR